MLVALFACSEDPVKIEEKPTLEGTYIVTRITGWAISRGIDGTRDTSIQDYEFDHTELIITDEICTITSNSKSAIFYTYTDGETYHSAFKRKMMPFSVWLEKYEVTELKERNVVIHSLCEINDVTMYLFKTE